MTNTATQTQTDSFSADLAAFISEETPHNPTPNEFIDLVERVRDVLGTASVGNSQDVARTWTTPPLASPTPSPAPRATNGACWPGRASTCGRRSRRFADRVLSALCAAPIPCPGAGAVAVTPQPREARTEMDVMGPPSHKVDVPLWSTAQPGLRGVRVFTGPADSRSTAVRTAYEVYDAAPRHVAGRTRAPRQAAGRTDGTPAATGPTGSRTGPPRRPATGTTRTAGSTSPTTATSSCRSAPGQAHIGVQTSSPAPGPSQPVRDEREIPQYGLRPACTGPNRAARTLTGHRRRPGDRLDRPRHRPAPAPGRRAEGPAHRAAAPRRLHRPGPAGPSPPRRRCVRGPGRPGPLQGRQRRAWPPGRGRGAACDRRPAHGLGRTPSGCRQAGR